MPKVYLNGEFLPLEEAKISPLDRGFTFAEGVYEVLPVFSGCIFRIDEHISRLKNSLSEIYIDNPYSDDKWKRVLRELLEQNGIGKINSIYLQVTRGVDERSHYYKQGLEPTVFALCKEETDKDFSSGMKVITHEDIRWKYCHIKAITLLPSVLLKKIAMETDGSNEAILTRDGLVTEGAVSNVFVVSKNIIKTPEKNGQVLPGITRDLVVELLVGNNIGCEEGPVTEEELATADEVWVTSSGVGIAPVTVMNGKKVGSGAPGDMWKKVNKIYLDFIENYSES